jgi:hypothetical protein
MKLRDLLFFAFVPRPVRLYCYFRRLGCARAEASKMALAHFLVRRGWL